MMYAIVSDVNEGTREALLFEIAPGRLRVIARGRSEASDLYSIDGETWIAESGQRVRFDFLSAGTQHGDLGVKAAPAA